MRLINPYAFGGGGGGGGGGEPPFSDVILLMHMDGTDGGTTFTDEKGTAVSLLVGSPTTSATQSKFGGTSLRVTGGASGVQMNTLTGQHWGTGDYCIEFWMRSDFSSNSGVPLDLRASSGGAPGGAQLFFPGGGNTMAVYNESNSLQLLAGTIVPGTWQFFALDRYLGTATMYVDGVAAGSWSDTTNYTVDILPTIGCGVQGNFGAPQYIDDVRLTKASRYRGTNFTPPTAAFPNS